MRLADFILQYEQAILEEWDEFARTNEPAASGMDAKALRNHAAQMLDAIARDIAQAQSREQAHAKSQARGANTDEDSAASVHGEARLLSGFTIDQLLSEYRALRASVLRLWADNAQMGLASDVGDIVRFNEAVDQAIAESVARYSRMINHSQHLFLAILGHDLRNPLNTTVVASQLLIKSPSLAPEQAGIAAKIHRSGLRMSKLVDDLIDYTRTHLGASLPMVHGHADLGAIVQGVADELRITRPERPIEVAVNGHTRGQWDEGRIAQVCSNLLGNALQHSPATSPVSVRVHGDAARVEVAVHNLGNPIAPEAVGMIFDPLVRIGGRKTHVDGADTSLGIGLYIAKTIVEAHGGAIGASSSREHGTTFTFSLPTSPPAPQREA
jgi:signal transduction histidine kinase